MNNLILIIGFAILIVGCVGENLSYKHKQFSTSYVAGKVIRNDQGDYDGCVLLDNIPNQKCNMQMSIVLSFEQAIANYTLSYRTGSNNGAVRTMGVRGESYSNRLGLSIYTERTILHDWDIESIFKFGNISVLVQSEVAVMDMWLRLSVPKNRCSWIEFDASLGSCSKVLIKPQVLEPSVLEVQSLNSPSSSISTFPISIMQLIFGIVLIVALLFTVLIQQIVHRLRTAESIESSLQEKQLKVTEQFS